MNFCYPCNLPFLISQKWNENPAYYSQIGMLGHNGWDFALVIGTPVYATHDGTVWFAGTDSSLAETVAIDTVDGTYRTFYGHLSSYSVTPGQKVTKGQQIGLSGNTGRYTMGPHLHFGVHPITNFSDTQHDNGYNGAIDPVHFFDGTYPNSTHTTQPVAIPPQADLFKKAILAMRDLQVQNGILDFATEQDPKKIKIGPKTLALITKLQK